MEWVLQLVMLSIIVSFAEIRAPKVGRDLLVYRYYK